MDENIKKEPIGSGVYIYVSAEHTFGTDAVLLNNFAAVRKNDRVTDLGTGCGIIPLLMLRDNKNLTVTGVDISDAACALAEKSAKDAGFENFTVICSDLKDLKGKMQFGNCSLVTCNPPYKATGAGILSRNERERTARHETACTLDDIVGVAARLLQTSGRLCMCQRPERLAELICTMQNHGIEPKRLRLVCKNPDSPPWLFLLEGRKGGNSGMTAEKSLYVHNADGSFSDEMIKIYGKYKEEYL